LNAVMGSVDASDAPSDNKKVAAFARTARFGEHGAERRADNRWTLTEIGRTI
jgi:hypothetical protein